ncbi:hypothetical protein M9Y10_036489 [Tritrichomonas musculus]|uniref:SecA family profile domain-containing protein n=1 Tax=Tritrichomonas musculus TaxID=1915356 RepID=A0ABR2GV79_9EUKA
MREKDPVKNIDFRIRKTQIYTVLEAFKKFFNDNSTTATIDDSKGSIFQIKTGEGKSCIVCLIAATLALKGKTVHIVSSNIKLSNRDYIESFEFFKMLNKKSAVLLHQNELPYYDAAINLDEEDESNIENEMNELKKNFYPDCYYANEHFENSSKMNFSTCGVDSNNNEYKGKANVVFSTFVNFE